MTHLLDLPSDTLLHALCPLSTDDLKNVLVTCKSLRALAHPNYVPLLWERVSYRRDLGGAAVFGFSNIVAHLMDLGAAADADDTICALYAACVVGHLDVVRLLLDRGTPTSTHKLPRLPVLRLAIVAGRIHVVNLLLDRGADGNDESILVLACKEGHAGMVRLLLDRGADSNNKDAIRVASRKGHLDVVRLLLDRRAKATYICDDADVAELLLERRR